MNKKTIDVVNVVEPAYFREFSCIGGDCPDSCCQSWGVSINKGAYKRLKKHKDIIVRQLVNENFKMVRNSEQEWAYIKMDPEGNCPALDKEGLCEIHKRCGHNQIPHTCQDYPRAANWFGDYIEASLFLSCPSAAEAILFNPASMMFEERQDNLSNINNSNTSGMIGDMLPTWLTAVRGFCFSLMLDEELTFEERVFSVGLFLKQADGHIGDEARLEQFINTFTEFYNEGKTKAMYAKLPTVEALKWQVFSYQDARLVNETSLFSGRSKTKGLSSAAIRFQQCRDQIMLLFSNNGQPTGPESPNNEHLADFYEDNVEGSSGQFNKVLTLAKTKYLNEYYAKNPQIWTNYALYYLYHFQFLQVEGKSLFEFFRVMVVDILMLKSYISGIAVNQCGITDAWFIKCVQSYSRRRQHNVGFIESVEKKLEESGTGGPGAIFGLLK